jgi:cytosine/adenosine deaminase-related metal-dependent hydrolase
MKKRRAGQMHAAGVRVVSGTDGGIAAAKPHGLLPVSAAFLVEGGVSAVAALASATVLAAAACGLGDSKGRLRAGYDADLLVADGDPAGGGVRRRAAPGRSSLTDQPGRRDAPGAAGRPRGSAGLTTETPYTRHAATVP